MTEHAVVIAGGGPTGLMLAGELALAGVDCVVVERRRTQDVEGSRSLGLLSRTIESLCKPGVIARELRQTSAAPQVHTTVTDTRVKRAVIDNHDCHDRRPHPGMCRLLSSRGEDSFVGALYRVCQQSLTRDVAATREHVSDHLDGKR